MSNRGKPFDVEIKRRVPGANYASKPGDVRRSGRATTPSDVAGMMPLHLNFADHSHAIEARLGVVTVGAVTHDITSKGYFWAVYLPGLPQTPRPARDADAAKRAILHKVREWCEAAKLISVRRG